MFTTIINFKTYPEGTAEFARTLATSCQQAADEHGFNIILAPQALDMKEIADNTDLFLVAQHCDPHPQGQSTGHIIPESIKLAGGSGSILNHSENKLPIDVLEETINRLKENNMMTIVCADSVEEAKRIASLNPDMIAFEPAELIGGEVSVVDADLAEVTQCISEIPDIPILIGAGIKSAHDISVAKDIGAEGALIASHAVKAPHPDQFLTELLEDVYQQ